MARHEGHSFAIVLLFFVILLFVGNESLPLTDPVEGNYALAAKEMIAAGDWISPRIFGNPWFDKPAFFLWELCAAFSLFGYSDFAARFFSSVFALASLALLYFFGRKVYGARTGLLAAGILATSFGFWYIGKAAVTDMTLFFFHNAALVAFYLGYSLKRRGLYYLSFAAAGFAVLTKGPIGFLLPGLLIAVFLVCRRDLREFLRLKWAGGLLLLLSVGGLWYFLMYLQHGAAFLDGFFGTHNFHRAAVSEHPRDDVWYYYTLIFLAGFFPWSFVFLYQGFCRRARLSLRLVRQMEAPTLFLWICALGVIFVYQSFATKYPTYTLPSLFFFALLLARGLRQAEDWLLTRLLLGLGMVFVALAYTLAAPLCAENSGKAVAADLRALPDDALIVSAMRIYSVSAVYYSDRKIFRLANAEDIPSLLPSSGGWNAARNIMPFYAYENLPTDRVFYLLADKKGLEDLRARFSGRAVEEVAEYPKEILLKVHGMHTNLP